MRRYTVVAASATAIASMGLAACGSSSPGSAGAGSTGSSTSPFTVLAIVASSGSLAAVTQSEMAGMQAAAKYVNAHGGILGHQVKITIKNDNLDPTTAANLLQQAVTGGSKPDLVYAGTTSDEALALMPILTQDKVFSLQTDVSDQTIDPSTHPFAFSLASSSEEFSADLAAATKAHYPSAKTIGILIGNNTNGTSLLQTEKPDLEAQGYKVFVQEYDPTNTINMTPQLQALKADGVQVLVASGFGAPAGYILKGRNQLGWNVPVVGDSAFSANPLPSMASAQALQGVSIMSEKSGIYAPISGRSQAWQTLYRAVLPKSGAFEVPFGLYEFGWDDIMVAQEAATQAKSLDSQAMTQAMENLKDPTNPLFLLGVYKYSATDHTPIVPVSDWLLASPYTKDGLALPFGQTG